MYSQTYWQDHVTEFLDRYKEVTNPDGTVTHTPVEGEILQQGTPQNQTNFNNIENGVQDASIAAAIRSTLQTQRLIFRSSCHARALRANFTFTA